MFSRCHWAAVALLIAAMPPAAWAADPADATVAVPQPEYRSAFSAYRKAGFDEKRDWRAANDAVGDAGGHAGALKDAAPADAGQAAPAMPMMSSPMMSSPMMHGHRHGGRQP